MIKDVLKVLDGKPLDLYVMTHEHMDHVQGLLYAADRLGVDVTKKLDVQYAWLTASGEGPAYYDRHPDAKRKKLEAVEAHRTVARFLMASYLDGNPGAEIRRMPSTTCTASPPRPRTNRASRRLPGPSPRCC